MEYLRCLLLIGCMSMNCVQINCLADEPDKLFTQDKGSLTITFRENQNPVPGGSVSVYQVAVYDPESEEHTLLIRKEFDDCQASAEEPDMDLLAKALAEHAAKNHIEGTKLSSGADASVRLEELELGSYLIVQDEAARGYEPVNPFLVTIPMKEKDTIIYDVDASPKVTTQKDPDKPNPPENNTPGTPPSRLPQTGQVWWPVPILAGMGLFFCFFCWFML